VADAEAPTAAVDAAEAEAQTVAEKDSAPAASATVFAAEAAFTALAYSLGADSCQAAQNLNADRKKKGIKFGLLYDCRIMSHKRSNQGH
jgi:hypothetical protein